MAHKTQLEPFLGGFESQAIKWLSSVYIWFRFSSKQFRAKLWQHYQATKVPKSTHSNQIGEIIAIIEAINTTLPFQPLIIITDSKYVIEGLTTHLGSWEDKGWIGIKNAPYFKKAAHLLRKCTTPTSFKWIKGHDRVEGNEESDRLAKEGAQKDDKDQVNLTIPKEFDMQGAKIVTLTQVTTYQGIREAQKYSYRPTIGENLQMIHEAIYEYTGTLEIDSLIWLSMRKQEIQTPECYIKC
jgi:ribonuclease HI